MVDQGTGRVYLDHAASAPLRACARQAWLDAYTLVGNPSSVHQCGQDAADVLAGAREQMAMFLGPGHDVVLTSGGTEALNLGVLGVLGADPHGAHIITSGIEHTAVLGSVARAEQMGATVTTVPADRDGRVDVQRVADALRPDTRLVCLQHANNETGVLQPVQQVADLVQDRPTLLLVDAVQTAGKEQLDTVVADLLAVSAHKFGGPRGVGALRVDPDVFLVPLVHGATHEDGRRAGTENVAGAAAMAAAARECLNDEVTAAGRARAAAARSRWNDGIAALSHRVVPVTTAPTLPETLSILVPGMRGDTVADHMDVLGYSVGTGSACHASGARPSHVLTCMGLAGEEALSALRISFSGSIDHDDIDGALDALDHVLGSLSRVAGTLSATTT